VARVRQHARVGVLYDAFWDAEFCTQLMLSDGAKRGARIAGGELRFIVDRPDRGRGHSERANPRPKTG